MMRIRSEAMGYVLAALVPTLVVTWWQPVYSWPLWIVLVVIVNFFRDPERISYAGSEAILSPADGKVVVARLANESEIQKFQLPAGSYKLSVFLNVFNVHVNRAPIAGTLVSANHYPGPKYPAFYEKASELNEHCDVVFQHASRSERIVVRLIAGLVARRIVLWVKPQSTVSRGERIGMIKLGSRADIYLPPSCQTAVQLGQKVVAGETILAKFIS